MTRIPKRKFWEGALTVGLGAGILALIPSQVGQIPGMQTNISPAFIPMLVGVSLILVGIAIAAGKRAESPKEKGSDFESGEPRRVLFAGLLLFAYAVLFPRLGFVAASAVFIGVFAFLFGQRDPWKLAALVVVLPVSVWILFEIIFRIPLPHGLLF